MTTQSKVTEWVEELKQIKGAVVSVGVGSQHPANPDKDKELDLQAYWETYPYLSRDKGYVHFMEIYSGLHFYRPEYFDLSVDIFGFSVASSQIERVNEKFLLWGESNIEERGLVFFSTASLPLADDKNYMDKLSAERVVGTSFGFHPNRRGVFKTKNLTGTELAEEKQIDIYYYCDKFTEWLEIMVENKGAFPEK